MKGPLLSVGYSGGPPGSIPPQTSSLTADVESSGYEGYGPGPGYFAVDVFFLVEGAGGSSSGSPDRSDRLLGFHLAIHGGGGRHAATSVLPRPLMTTARSGRRN